MIQGTHAWKKSQHPKIRKSRPLLGLSVHFSDRLSRIWRPAREKFSRLAHIEKPPLNTNNRFVYSQRTNMTHVQIYILNLEAFIILSSEAKKIMLSS